MSAHVVRLALGLGLLGFQPEWARAVKKVSKVFKVFKVSKVARRGGTDSHIAIFCFATVVVGPHIAIFCFATVVASPHIAIFYFATVVFMSLFAVFGVNAGLFSLICKYL